jgi:hypothetical protein
MRQAIRLSVVVCLMSLLPLSSAAAQTPQDPPAAPAPMFVSPPPPPATLLERFKPANGSVLTIGSEDLGEVAGISVDVRELRDSSGNLARGVIVEMSTGRQAPREQSFVDEDELPELMKGFDALLGISQNPTPFKNFDVQYATKGELVLTASSSRNRGILYRVEVGRFVKLRSGPLTAGEIHQLRTLFEGASQKLATVPARR